MTLKITDVTVDYPETTIGPLALTVDPGVTAVLGPSGAGKSTLLAAIAGFESLQSGTIVLDGQRLDGHPPEDRNVGLVFQDGALFPHLSVRENLAFGAAPGRDVPAVARRLDIADLLDRAPETLSGGERKRVALARTLAADPDALLLDEPLASLDAPIRRRLRLELRDVLAALDVPVLYVTHDREEAMTVGDRLAILHGGTIGQTGPVEAIFDAPASPTVAEFIGFQTAIEGIVRGRATERTRVDIGPTELVVPAETDADRVVLAVRPADLTVDPDDPAMAIEARVASIAVRPTGAVCTCEWGGGEPLRVRIDRSAADGLTVGTPVTLGIDPGSCRLLQRDG
ncbi:ABC transporter ATP-binding protein [Halorhabdus rudnickae]|uniref:ABC transporter ATP-binding protein n=1 Tax=Halorhabdus rudnickae TaxID=1775544 RepID=UPI0010845347|nr:ABC transporter ATP-binding protein [Halorhabdus rudnickae]